MTQATAPEAENAVCGVCFGEIDPVDNPQGSINSCHHIFCFCCISTWAKETNVCPQCKARFSRITTVEGAGRDPTVLKIRKKNYKGWLEDSEDDDDDGEESDHSATRRQVQVRCEICKESENTIRMLMCDRHTCTFVAHLDCLKLSEAPPTFVCHNCSRRNNDNAQDVLNSRSMIEADARLARQLELEIAEEDDRIATVEHAPPPPPPVPAARPAMVPVVALQAAAPRVAPPVAPQVVAAAPVDDGIPYYLRPNAQSEVALQQLQSRLETSRYLAEKKAAKKFQAQQVVKRQREIEEAERKRDGSAVAAPAPGSPEFLKDMERRLLRTYYEQQVDIVRRQKSIEDNQLRLTGMGGSIAVAKPPTRIEHLHREEEIRAQAMRIAQRQTSERMSAIYDEARQRSLRAIQRKSEREAEALARLAEIVALHRAKEAKLRQKVGQDQAALKGEGCQKLVKEEPPN